MSTMTKRRRWSLLVTVGAGLLLITLDNSILYTALPTLTEDLQASSTQSLWIINAYPLVMAGLLLGSGTLGDRIGHTQMFVVGLVIFGLASLLAALAPSPEVLIGARAVLAVGAAAMMPATLALIRTYFTVERKRNFAIAVWGQPVGRRVRSRSDSRRHAARVLLVGLGVPGERARSGAGAGCYLVDPPGQ